MQNAILMAKILDVINKNKLVIINIPDIELILVYIIIDVLLKYN